MITATVNGFANVGKKANFAVCIKHGPEIIHERLVPLKSKSAYFAELAAIKYVLQTFSEKEKDVDLTVNVSLKHIPRIFDKKEDGKWVKKQKTNKGLVKQLRDLSERFNSFKCELDENSDEMQMVKDMTRSLPA